LLLKSYELTYRRTPHGFELVGPRNREAQEVILEQPLRKVSG